MHLSQLLAGLCYKLVGDGDKIISSLCCDTSKVKRDCMFFCLKGEKYDGHDFYAKAVGDGASVVVCQRQLDTQATQVVVEDVRSFMAQAAERFFGNPAEKLRVVSVVGTNGKTSTTYILDAIFKKAGFNTGVIGTNGVFINGKKHETDLTTPDPIELNYWLSQMYLNKVRYVFVEVSAHAIYYKKLWGIRAETAVFTNFSQDHLDFFKDMGRYAATKRAYFCQQYARTAVVNADDKLGKEILANADVQVVGYSVEGDGDSKAFDVKITNDGSEYVADLFGDQVKVRTRLCGKFNVYNTLCAATVARIFGISPETIAEGIYEVQNVDGRNETILRDDGVRIVVDFAHTPDGVRNVLSYLRSVTSGKLFVVFGCGGNRDKFKRPLMGREVSDYADLAIVTNDNPRFEEPAQIARDVQAGLTCPCEVILNRARATERALSLAKEGDVVALLGKGAEKYQEIRGRKYPYSDVETVHKLLRKSGE